MANKRRNEIERLEEELKQLQQENRRLKRQGRQKEKYPKRVKEKTTEKLPEGSCISCGKGDPASTTFEFPTYHLLVMKCDICGHTERQRLKK